MDNNFNLNQKQLNALLSMAKKKTGINVEEMKKSMENGNMDDFVSKNLDADAANKLKKILSDKQTAENMLNTPQAKELLKKILEGK